MTLKHFLHKILHTEGAHIDEVIDFFTEVGLGTQMKLYCTQLPFHPADAAQMHYHAH